MNLKHQYNYSEINPKMFSFKNRKEKALKIVAILDDFLTNKFSKRISDLVCLEVGCSAGGMTRIFAKNFKKVMAIDIDEKAIKKAQKGNILSSVKYQIGDALKLCFNNNSFDIVICNHVYEHLSDSFKTMDEIERVLKKNGVCYFAGPNKYTLIEPHYFLPFLSWLPKPIGSFFIKITGKGDCYYETLFSRRELRRLVSKFKVYDYTVEVLKKPKKFYATHRGQELISYLPSCFLKTLQAFMPSFFWILVKKKSN